MTTKAWMNRMRLKRQRGVQVLDRTEVPFGTCELCSATGEELRPYGPKEEWICFDCGMKNEATTQRQCARIAFGISKN